MNIVFNLYMAAYLQNGCWMVLLAFLLIHLLSNSLESMKHAIVAIRFGIPSFMHTFVFFLLLPFHLF